MYLVRKQLGSGAFGTYAWLINAMILLTALKTAWIGDSLTVLDRFDPRTRSGLTASLIAFAFLAIFGATALGLIMLGAWSAALFGLMVMLWGAEEIGRRLFMARMSFGALLFNDTVYAIGAFAALAIAWPLHGSITLTMVVFAMTVGAAASIVSAFIQLPHDEWRWQQPSWSAARELVPFASWRAAQLSIRPLAQFAVRSIVIGLVSRVAAGDLESARLFSQPAMTYVSGVASLLLPMYANEERMRKRSVPLPVMTSLLVLPVALYAAIVIGLKGTIARHLFDAHAHVSTSAVLGWLAIALLFAAGQPVANVLVARKQSRQVFYVRAADSAIGLALAVVAIKVVSVDLAPWSLAAGMVVGTVWLAVIARHHPTSKGIFETHATEIPLSETPAVDTGHVAPALHQREALQ